MPGQARGNDELRGFFVADFAQHDNVGVLAQYASKPRGKSKTYLRIYLRLIYAVDVILNRIFKGNNINPFAVKHGKYGIERRGFSRSRGTGYESHAMGLFNPLLYNLYMKLIEPKIGKRRYFFLRLQYSHHDFFNIVERER